MRFFEAIGRTVIRILEEFGHVFQMLGRVAGWTFRPPYDVPEFFRQMVRVGVDSVPVVFLTTLFTGMVMALQTVNGFARFHAESLVGSVVALSLTLELWLAIQDSSRSLARGLLLPGMGVQRLTTREPRLDETRVGWDDVTGFEVHGVAQLGHGPVASSTHNHVRTRGTSRRTASHCSANAPWKTTAVTSALSHR